MGDKRVMVVIAGENQTQAALREVQAGLGGVGQSASSLTKLLAGLTAAFGTRELVAWAKSLIEAQDQIGKAAQKIGVSTEALSGLSYAAKLSDVEFDALVNGLRFFNKSIAEAQSGSGEAAATFRSLGISIRDASGNLRPTDQLLLQVAEKFSGMEDGANKTAAAMRLFGRAGADLIPFLNQSPAQIAEFRAEAERLGLVVDGKTAAAAERLNDSLLRLQGAVRGAGSQFLSAFLPPLADAAEGFVRAAGGAEQFRLAGERLAQWLIQAVPNFVGFSFALESLGLHLQSLAERAKLLSTFGLVGDPGKIAQYSIEINGLADDLAKLRQGMDQIGKAPSFQDLFNPSQSITQTLRNLGLASTGRTAPPLPGGGAAAAKPEFLPDTGDLRTTSELLAEIDKWIRVLGEDARTAFGGAKNEAIGFLAEFKAPLPTGWPDELKALEAQVDVLFSKLRAGEEAIRGQVERGDISEIQGAQQIIALHQQTGAELDALLPRYRELAALTGDPRLAAGVEELAARTRNLQNETSALAATIRSSFVENFSSAFAAIASGTEEVAGAFKRMAQSILAELARIIAKMFIIWLLNKLLGGLFGGGGGGGIGATSITMDQLDTGNFQLGGSFSAGEPFIAGEYGMPELIVPQTAGIVVPHAQLKTMQSGEGDTFIINAPGADVGVVQRLERLERTMPQTVGASVKAMFEYQRRK